MGNLLQQEVKVGEEVGQEIIIYNVWPIFRFCLGVLDRVSYRALPLPEVA